MTPPDVPPLRRSIVLGDAKLNRIRGTERVRVSVLHRVYRVDIAGDGRFRQGGAVAPEFDESRKRPYKTGELATLFEVSNNTIIRWIETGRFGAENVGWRWTPGGKGIGDREVLAAAVKKYLGLDA